MQTAGNSKLRCQHADFFMRTCRKQLLRPLRHTDNPERMRPPQTVYTKHRQRIAGYNYLLNVFGCQPIDYFSHKTADFFFSTGAVRRTRSITHINKILVRQHLMQAFQNRQTADSRIKYADWLHFIHKNTLPYFLYFNTLIISLIYVCVYKKQAKKTFFTCFLPVLPQFNIYNIYPAVRPPSTVTMLPVIKLFAGAARLQIT